VPRTSLKLKPLPISGTWLQHSRPAHHSAATCCCCWCCTLCCLQLSDALRDARLSLIKDLKGDAADEAVLADKLIKELKAEAPTYLPLLLEIMRRYSYIHQMGGAGCGGRGICSALIRDLMSPLCGVSGTQVLQVVEDIFRAAAGGVSMRLGVRLIEGERHLSLMTKANAFRSAWSSRKKKKIIII